MAILYVDTEHDLVLADPRRGPEHRARLDAVRARLAAMAGMPCVVERFAAASPAAITRLAPTAVIIGGNITGWEAYGEEAWAALFATIRAAPVPILGICAGHQLIGRAHAAAWGPLGPLRPGEIDPDPAFGPGQRKERGFLPVEVDHRCALFTGIAAPATFFQHHYWQLMKVPPGFVVRARSRWSAIQAIEREDRPVFGVQFHPERADAAHPRGMIVLRNFFALAQRAGGDAPAAR